MTKNSKTGDLSAPDLPPKCDIVRRAELRLKGSGWNALRSIECDWDDGILTLSGQVSSWYLKQLAQTVVGVDRSVAQILNHINVNPMPR